MYSRELGASGSIRLDPGKLYYLVFTNEGSILGIKRPDIRFT